jgi:photosystem II stability/assembly factor-like uncharacterized protein
MKRLLPLLVWLLLLTACEEPEPQLTSTPGTPLNPSPTILPAPVATLALASPAPGVTLAPETVTPPTAILPASAAVLPALVQTFDLGFSAFTDYANPHALALDEQANRLYVSLAPSRTLVLEANTLTAIGEIPAGGALSIDPAASRLYVGVPGYSTYGADGTSTLTPAELAMFDTTNFNALRRVIPNPKSMQLPIPAIDPLNRQLYLTQSGVTRLDATTLEPLESLSGTVPIENGLVPNYAAGDAVLDPQRQRLFVSLNNGIPGSNNGNVLAVYDLTTGQVLERDEERSITALAVDPLSGEAVAPRIHLANWATVKYDAQGRRLKRLDDLAGLAVQINPATRHVFVLDAAGGGPQASAALFTLDRDLNMLGLTPLNGNAGWHAMLFDPERDRLYVLARDGQLLVLQGQAQPVEPANILASDRLAALALIPIDQTLYGIFAANEYPSGNGHLFQSNDAGATWQAVGGLPATIMTLTGDASTLLAAVDVNGSAPGSWGVWRSDDGGQTWLPSSRGLTDLGITRLVASPDFARDDTVYALSRRGVFRSVDRGATWQSLADRYAPLLKDLTVSFNALALSPRFGQDHALLIGHSSGLWRSTDRGESWTNIAGGPAASRLAYAPDSAPNGVTVFAVTFDGVQRSTDGGLTWSDYSSGLDLNNAQVSDVKAGSNEVVALIARFGQPGAVYRILPGEPQWQRAPIERDVTALTLSPAGDLLIGAADGRVQRAP